MFFEGGHPVPVYTLANAAREIITSIANRIGVTTAVQDVAASEQPLPAAKKPRRSHRAGPQRHALANAARGMASV